MAIDFGRMFRGVATGYIGAKIENTAANDRLKANIMESAGQNFFNNVLPEAVEQENTRKENYNLILSSYKNPNVAELADINGFTADKASMARFDELMKANKLDAKKLEGVVFDTDYNTRYNTRAKSFEEKYQPILNQIGLKEIGGLGYNTVETLVGDKKPAQMQTQDVAPVPPEPASTRFADYLTVSPISYDIPESEFQKVASTMREFGQFFTQDPRTGEPVVNLNDTNRNEYNALRNITQEISQNYLDQDGKVNVSAAMAAASNALTEQTSTMIYGKQLGPDSGYENDYEQGIASADGKTFSKNFNKIYKTDRDKKQYLSNGLKNLDGGQEAQRFFAQSFPEDVLFNDKTKVKDYLLRLTGLLR
tara:strand:- start:48 stop:1142 length:1095 start_codon:yes stop_codon:yes gene_type:complete